MPDNAPEDDFGQRFWAQQAQNLDWHQPFHRVVESVDGGPRYRWFSGGKTSLCHNALDRHLAERGDKTALIHRDYQGLVLRLSYRELWEQVNALSCLMAEWGIRPGDRVLIVLPVMPLAVAAMLACSRLAAVHVVIYSSVSSEALSQRIRACQPSLLLFHSADRGRGQLPEIPPAGTELRIIDTASSEFRQQLAAYDGQTIPCQWVESQTPSHLLFTSGTTGEPKGVVRDTGGYAVALLASLQHLFRLEKDEIMFTSADIGWVTGHSYGVYAPLLAGATTVLCESSELNMPGQSWWRMVEELGITRMLTIAGAIRMARQQGEPRASLKSLRSLYLAGEPLDQATCDWVTDKLQVPCENHYWQTESGWPLMAGQGRALSPVFSRSVTVINPQNGARCAAGETGMLVVNHTLGPGGMLTLWQDDRQHDQYYWLQRDNGWNYATHDCALWDGRQVIIQGRLDDVVNIGGKRLSASEVESAVAGITGISEIVATKTPHHLLGEMIVLYVVTCGLSTREQQQLKKIIRERITTRCGRHALPRKIYFRQSLPKTFSGKYLRRQLQA